MQNDKRKAEEDLENVRWGVGREGGVPPSTGSLTNLKDGTSL